jgi:hypothetical protein
MKYPPKYIFPAGMRFGSLQVIEDRLNGVALCLCNCGTVREISKAFLKRGQFKSCGQCQRGHPKHGMHKTPTYNVWAGMLSRCRNPKHKWFDRYGGRGISVCEHWADFQNFFADMGKKPPGFSIDRIDNDGNYSFENCRWATAREQIRNRSNTRMIEYEGNVISIAELAGQRGISNKKVFDRLERGYSIEQAIANVRYNRWK